MQRPPAAAGWTLCALLLLLLAGARGGFAEPTAEDLARQHFEAQPPAVSAAQRVLASQPAPMVTRLMSERVVVVADDHDPRAATREIITSYVIFDSPIEHTYAMLSRSDRQVEFRPELTSIETIESTPEGPVDEHRLKILFSRYVYRIAYRLDPAANRIEWKLDHRFENDLDEVYGFWELYEMPDGRTLGRSGTSVDVGPQVPAFLQDWMTRKNLPTTMERVRLWVDSGGSYRP